MIIFNNGMYTDVLSLLRFRLFRQIALESVLYVI